MDECFTESLVYSDSDNSETEETIRSPHIPEKDAPSPSAENAPNGIEDQLQETKVSDESDEDDINKSICKKKKSARILSSDDEISNDQTDSHDTHNEVKVSNTFRPSICDSDTKSSSADDKIEEKTQTNKKMKKLKKKKQKVRKMSENSKTNSDSEDGISSDEEEITKKPHPKRSSSNQSSNSSSSDSNSNDDADVTQNIEPREKPVQRVIKFF